MEKVKVMIREVRGIFVNKQSIIIQALETLENSVSSSTQIKNQIHHIREKIKNMSNKEFESEMSMAVTSPAGESTSQEQSIRFLLDETFPELEQTFQGTQANEVLSAMRQIRGIIGTDDNLHFPS
jgi:hypothetical protein